MRTHLNRIAKGNTPLFKLTITVHIVLSKDNIYYIENLEEMFPGSWYGGADINECYHHNIMSDEGITKRTYTIHRYNVITFTFMKRMLQNLMKE